MLSEKQMYSAISLRDNRFDGQFVYGVVTTGVFCKPSCPSKMAKFANMRFFADVATAMQFGFRPCKRCQPLGASEQVDKLIKLAIYIEQHAQQKLTLQHLAKLVGLSASGFQRAFRSVFAISPKQYQDALRLTKLKQGLHAGESVTDAIYDAGFSSVSRVYGESSRDLGMSLNVYRAGGEGEVIYYACRQSVLGHMLMAATAKGVCSVLFADQPEQLIELLSKEFPKAQLQLSTLQDSPEMDAWMLALDKHLGEGAPRPDIPLDIRGTAFQVKVWQFLMSIKQGEVSSYRQVAEQIDSPKAVRAVGTACGKNRIAVLIPCHRVLRSDGGLGGYKWGLERKRALLDKERS